MTEINKTNLITRINTAISAFNLSTEDANTLSIFYKAAINAGTSADSIVTEMTSRIQAASSLSTSEQLLLFAVVTSILTPNRVMSVADLTALNALSSTVSAGSVYHVDSEGLPYVKKSDGSWSRIDPASQNTLLPNAFGWGNNLNGRLGDNTITNRSSPVSVVGGITDWVQLSAGGSRTLGIDAQGIAWAFGSNLNGQLGDNTSSTSSKSSPVSVVGGFTDWIDISAGRGTLSLGLRADGTAWSWGLNDGGQLGDGTVIDKSSPVSVIGGFVDWTQLSAGVGHCLGIRANGTAWAWGNNLNGRLGNNTAVNTSSPVSVVGGFADWIQLSAGSSHSLGIRVNGTAWSWGSAGNGRLGDNTTISKSSPVSVVGGFVDWIQVSAGNYHSVGLRANGTAWTWGGNNSGQLGDGTIVQKVSPVSVVGGFTDWIQLSAGNYHSVGLRANGTAWAWGNNIDGRLGDNTNVTKSSPVSLVGGFVDWIQISAGFAHSIAIRGSNSTTG